jgi:hypothetical protein
MREESEVGEVVEGAGEGIDDPTDPIQVVGCGVLAERALDQLVAFQEEGDGVWRTDRHIAVEERVYAWGGEEVEGQGDA